MTETTETLDVLEWTIEQPEVEYHAQAGNPRNGKYWTSSLQKKFIENPRLVQFQLDGKVAGGSSEAQSFGSAVHCLILTPELFGHEFQDDLGAPVNPSTGKPYGVGTKNNEDWRSAQTRTIISASEMTAALRMKMEVFEHDEALRLLKCGVAERVIRRDLYGIPCQSRIDWLSIEGDDLILCDLKTCADLAWFESDFRKFGYLYQLAFYRRMILAASGRLLPVRVIAVEKKEPFRVGVWEIVENAVHKAEIENEQYFGMLKECLEFPAEQKWPTGFEDVRQILD